jgi:hypothetical protein
MKKIIILLALFPFFLTNAQEIGKVVPEKEPEIFPDNAYGLDIMFGEGGPGLGAFYRHQLSRKFTLFTDISLSETKDEKEFEYIDYFGNTFTIGKKNRVFSIPVMAGLQYRLFENSINDNLRPYVNLGLGPTIVMTTPYSVEYFSAFGKAKLKYALGGYIGFGANFGLDKTNLLGINFRYYLIHFFDEGVESLYDKYRKNIGTFYVTLNLGLMY